MAFIYDFAFDRPFTPEDLEKIEARAKKSSKRDLPVTRAELSQAKKAMKFFQERGEAYKVEIDSRTSRMARRSHVYEPG